MDVPILIAHCVHVDEEDIRLLARPNVSVVTNPASNMKLGNGFAPVPEMLASGVRVCLGTDGAASNNSLNLFHEMGLVTCLLYTSHLKTWEAAAFADDWKLLMEQEERQIQPLMDGLKAVSYTHLDQS